MTSEAEMAWCAGLFEGEGTVVYGASHLGPLVIKISSTDHDVLMLMATRSGVGRVSGPHAPTGFGVKPVYEWRTNGVAAERFLRRIQPWLGERRSARVDEKIALYRSRPGQRKTNPAVRAAIRARRREGVELAEIGAEFGIRAAFVGQICSGYVHPNEKAADDKVNGPSHLTREAAASMRRTAPH